MQINLKNDQRRQSIEKALKNNLKKRKVFQEKFKKRKKSKWPFYQIDGLKKWPKKKKW